MKKQEQPKGKQGEVNKYLFQSTIGYLKNQVSWHKDNGYINLLAQILKHKQPTIHAILTAEDGDVIASLLEYFTITPNPNYPVIDQYNLLFGSKVHRKSVEGIQIILDASPLETFAAMNTRAQAGVLQWTIWNGRFDLAKKLFKAIPAEDRVEVLSYNDTAFNLARNKNIPLKNREKLIDLLKHLPEGWVTRIDPTALIALLPLALGRGNEECVRMLASPLTLETPAQRLSLVAMVLPEVDYENDELPSIANINAMKILLKLTSTEDIVAGWSRLNEDYTVLADLAIGSIACGRVDLANIMLDQIVSKNLSEKYLKHILYAITTAGHYDQIDLLKTALACIACVSEEAAVEFIIELVSYDSSPEAKHKLPEATLAMLKDYLEPSSLCRQEVTQMGELINAGIPPSETLARLREAEIASTALIQDHGLPKDLAKMVADHLVKVDKVPSSASQVTNSTSSISASSPVSNEAISQANRGPIRWADEEEASAISPTYDDHKANEARRAHSTSTDILKRCLTIEDLSADNTSYDLSKYLPRSKQNVATETRVQTQKESWPNWTTRIVSEIVNTAWKTISK
jgi:hypothetical protein